MNLDSARDLLIRHSKSTRNGVFPPNTDRTGRLLNPLCGDQVEFRVRIVENRIESLGFATKACAICAASASLLAETAEGQDIDEMQSLRAEFEAAVSDSETAAWPTRLLAFASFAHLRVNPRRRACAILPWLALAKTLKEG